MVSSYHVRLQSSDTICVVTPQNCRNSTWTSGHSGDSSQPPSLITSKIPLQFEQTEQILRATNWFIIFILTGQKVKWNLQIIHGKLIYAQNPVFAFCQAVPLL